MSLGNSLYQARKKSGLSQEIVAEKLGVSRQTISKWETDDTVPDIYQAKKLSKIYNLSLDELIEFDTDLKQIEETIKNTNEEVNSKVNWTKVWGKKYPILIRYQKEVNIPKYAKEIRRMFTELQCDYKYSELDAMLVLKDILGHEYLDNKNNK